MGRQKGQTSSSPPSIRPCCCHTSPSTSISLAVACFHQILLLPGLTVDSLPKTSSLPDLAVDPFPSTSPPDWPAEDHLTRCMTRRWMEVPDWDARKVRPRRRLLLVVAPFHQTSSLPDLTIDPVPQTSSSPDLAVDTLPQTSSSPDLAVDPFPQISSSSNLAVDPFPPTSPPDWPAEDHLTRCMTRR